MKMKNKLNNGCIDCASQQGVSKCADGHSEQCHKWWVENGEKYRVDNNFDSMMCYKESEISKICNDLQNFIKD